MLQADDSESHSLNAFVNNLVRLDAYHTLSLDIQIKIESFCSVIIIITTTTITTFISSQGT